MKKKNKNKNVKKSVLFRLYLNEIYYLTKMP